MRRVKIKLSRIIIYIFHFKHMSILYHNLDKYFHKENNNNPTK